MSSLQDLSSLLFMTYIGITGPNWIWGNAFR